MNERIRELALQAGYKPLSPPTFADELNEIFMQKFAELIIKECMNKTAGYLLEDEFGGSDVKEASEELAKHFGVEE